MRVTQNMTSNNALYNIQQTRTRLDHLNEQAASGNNFNRPGEDPIGTRQLLDFDSKIRQGDQYVSNIKKADIWQNMTNTVLGGINDLLAQGMKLVSSVTGGANDPVSMQMTANQLKDIKSQIIDIANTKIGDLYLLGGFETRNAPFTTADNLYHGSSDSLTIDVSQTSTMNMNIKGDELILGTGSYGSINILQTFDNLVTSINAGNTAAIQADAKDLQQSQSQIFSATTDVQGKIVRLDSMKTLVENQKNTLLSMISNIQTVDLAKVGIELQQEKTAFEAALSTTAKISQLSLLDYLR